jgi:hypothetical protein
MIDAASKNSRNRGEFLRAVVRGLNDMRKQGLLPSRLHGHFLHCANSCNWDDAKKREQRDNHRGQESHGRR